MNFRRFIATALLSIVLSGTACAQSLDATGINNPSNSSGSGSGGGPLVFLGTSAAATNPQRSGQAGTGLYTAGSGLVDFSSDDAQQGEFSSAGLELFNPLFFNSTTNAQTSFQNIAAGKSAPNILNECPIIAFAPNLLTDTGATLQQDIQDALDNCESLAYANHPFVFYNAFGAMPKVMATFPANFTPILPSNLWVPPLVALDATGVLFVRDGTNSPASSTYCDGNFTSNCNGSRGRPFIFFMEGSDNLANMQIQSFASGQNTDGGSGWVAFEGYPVTAMALASGGTGFIGTPPYTCTTTSPFIAPYNGATFTCTAQSGGACTAISYTYTANLPTSGVYPLPQFLLQRQYTSAAWIAAGGTNPFAVNGTDLKTTCTGTNHGTGLIITPTWGPDTTGGTPIWKFSNSTTSVSQQYLGNIRQVQGSDFVDANYGPVIGGQIASNEVTANFLQTQFDVIGLQITGSDHRINIHNDVGSAIELKAQSGSNNEITFSMEDTCADPGNTQTGATDPNNRGCACAQIDNEGFRLPLIECFHNASAVAGGMAVNQIQIGQTSSSSAGKLSSGIINALCTNQSSSATSNTCIAADWFNDVRATMDIQNTGLSSTYTVGVNFTSTHGSNSNFGYNIGGVAGPTVAGTVPSSVRVVEDNGNDGKTYIYNPTQFQSTVSTGSSVGIAVGTSSLTAGTAIDAGSNTSSILLPIGTSGTRPTGVNGMIRYNSTLNNIEGFVSGAWASLIQTFRLPWIASQYYTVNIGSYSTVNNYATAAPAAGFTCIPINVPGPLTLSNLGFFVTVNAATSTTGAHICVYPDNGAAKPDTQTLLIDSGLMTVGIATTGAFTQASGSWATGSSTTVLNGYNWACLETAFNATAVMAITSSNGASGSDTNLINEYGQAGPLNAIPTNQMRTASGITFGACPSTGPTTSLNTGNAPLVWLGK